MDGWVGGWMYWIISSPLVPIPSLLGTLAPCLVATWSPGGLLETPSRWHMTIYIEQKEWRRMFHYERSVGSYDKPVCPDSCLYFHLTLFYLLFCSTCRISNPKKVKQADFLLCVFNIK